MMVWNEQGGDRDPWNQSGREQGPPDLEAMIRKLSDRFGGLLGRKGQGQGSAPPPSGTHFTGIAVLIGVIAVIGWSIASIYIVNEGERGVVLRFGRYLETTMPGPHLRIFPIDRVEIVNLEQRRFREIGYRSNNAGNVPTGSRQSGVRTVPKEALMLTRDENIVDVRMAVQYQISDPRAYLFNVQDAEGVLVQAVESAARETIGKGTMDFVLTEGRSSIVADIKSLGQRILDSYDPSVPLGTPATVRAPTLPSTGKGAGLHIVTVVLQDAQPPEEVQDAFADAIKAREDEQRLKNEAEAYANEVIPRARGQAARRLQEASAYKEQAVAQAQGEASRFDQLLGAYLRSPEVTRERLYLETMETVLSHTSKVIVDVKNTNNLMYLPLDRWLKKPGEGGRSTVTELAPLPTPIDEVPSTSPLNPNRMRDVNRSREAR